MTPSPQQRSTDDVALAYQPRRTRGAVISIGINLLAAGGFLAGGGARWMDHSLQAIVPWPVAMPVYLVVYFLAYAIVNLPLDLWYGYLEERHFGLAKDGVRAWGRDALKGLLQQGMLFAVGSGVILVVQRYVPHYWIAVFAGILLGLILVTTWRAYDMLPKRLFQFQPADEATARRLQSLCPLALPPVVVYTHSAHREFNGGLLGLGGRQRLLISQATIDLASDALVRFILLHEAGHRRHHHLIFSAILGWAWMLAGLMVANAIIPMDVHATAVYIAFLAPIFSAWMVITEPLLAAVGRRLEYQADDFYLRHGGSAPEMATALHELARRNLARVDWESPTQPLPPVKLRIERALALSIFKKGKP